MVGQNYTRKNSSWLRGSLLFGYASFHKVPLPLPLILSLLGLDPRETHFLEVFKPWKGEHFKLIAWDFLSGLGRCPCLHHLWMTSRSWCGPLWSNGKKTACCDDTSTKVARMHRWIQYAEMRWAFWFKLGSTFQPLNKQPVKHRDTSTSLFFWWADI